VSGFTRTLDMLKVHVSRIKLKGHDACLISVNAPKDVDLDLAYAEYVQKLEDKCNAKIGVLTSLDLPTHLFVTLLRATADVLGTAAVSLPEGIVIVFAEPGGPFAAGDFL